MLIKEKSNVGPIWRDGINIDRWLICWCNKILKSIIHAGATGTCECTTCSPIAIETIWNSSVLMETMQDMSRQRNRRSNFWKQIGSRKGRQSKVAAFFRKIDMQSNNLPVGPKLALWANDYPRGKRIVNRDLTKMNPYSKLSSVVSGVESNPSGRLICLSTLLLRVPGVLLQDDTCAQQSRTLRELAKDEVDRTIIANAVKTIAKLLTVILSCKVNVEINPPYMCNFNVDGAQDNYYIRSYHLILSSVRLN